MNPAKKSKLTSKTSLGKERKSKEDSGSLVYKSYMFYALISLEEEWFSSFSFKSFLFFIIFIIICKQKYTDKQYIRNLLYKAEQFQCIL